MYLYIAWRQILYRRRQSIASILSIALGVGLFIMMSSMQRGFEDDFTERVIAVTPHVQINAERLRPFPDLGKEQYDLTKVLHVQAFDKTEIINGATYLQDKLIRMEGVVAVGASYTGQGLISYGNRETAAIIRGIDPEKENQLNGFYGKLKIGRQDALYMTSNAIIIGSGVAKTFKSSVGDTLNVVTDSGYQELYRVVDIYQSGITAFDNKTVFVLLKNSKALFGVDGPNVINLKLKDPYQAEKVAADVADMTGLNVKNWLAENANIRSELGRRKWINQFIVGTIFIVAGFGIANIMTMNVMNKRRDIAIMEAFGIGAGSIGKIYLLQGFLLGLIGAFLGVMIGFGLNIGLENIPVSFNAQLTREGFPVAWSGSIFIEGYFMGLVISVAASFFPARKAAAILPAEVIRRG